MKGSTVHSKPAINVIRKPFASLPPVEYLWRLLLTRRFRPLPHMTMQTARTFYTALVTHLHEYAHTDILLFGLFDNLLFNLGCLLEIIL